MYLLQEEEAVSNEQEQEVDLGDKTIEGMEVSIHAISDFMNFNSMRLLGKMGSVSIEILVDSGSIHNFLDPKVVQVVRVLIDTRMQIKVANGQRITSEGSCREMVLVQGTKYKIPFHIFPLGGCDIVLGV